MTGFINKKYGKKKLYKYLYREQNSGFFQPKNRLKLSHGEQPFSRNMRFHKTAFFTKYGIRFV